MAADYAERNIVAQKSSFLVICHIDDMCLTGLYTEILQNQLLVFFTQVGSKSNDSLAVSKDRLRKHRCRKHSGCQHHTNCFFKNPVSH